MPDIEPVFLGYSCDQPVLRKGQRTNGHIGLIAYSKDSPQKTWLPSNFRLNLPGEPATKVNKIEPLAPKQAQWTAGADPDLVNFDEIRKVAPDFHPPQAGQPGFIFVAITNLSPNTVSIQGFHGVTKFYSIQQDALPWNETLALQARMDGGFDISILAAPLIAPMPCLEFHGFLPGLSKTAPNQSAEPLPNASANAPRKP